MARASVWLMVGGALLAGCSGDKDSGTEVTPRDFSSCDPISYGYCSFPFPSTYYMREDSTSPTGWRVNLGAETIPYTDQAEISYQPRPDFWNERDGFSPLAPLLIDIPNLSLDGVPGHDDIGASLLETSPVAVVDLETGERMPVWAELDMSDTFSPSHTLLIYPAVPLRNGHRYAVGLRNLTLTTGEAAAPTEGFKALRDGTATSDWDIEGRRDRYEAIFAALEQQGWARSEVISAWDLVIASAEGITAKAEFIRDDALAQVGPDGPDYVIDEVTDEYSDQIYRRVTGHFTAPLYTEEDATATVLTRDEDGMPYLNGTTEVPFTILIPRTAVEDPRPLPIMQYGHGLLGGQDEVQSGYLGEMANRYGFVVFATDWTGMKSEDSDAIVEMILTQIDRFAMIPERSQQGFGEFFVMAHLMKTGMLSEPTLQFPDAGGAMVSVIDPETHYYYGNSQGAILGGSYVALSNIERAVLGVGGGPYALLLYRSADFTPFFIVFRSVYDDSRDIAMWMVLMQTLWDSAESAGYGRQMTEAPLDGLPAHQILMQDAIGDAQVTTLGAATLARAWGSVQVGTPVKEIWGLETVASPYTGNALAEYDFGVPPIPYENVPPDSNYDTHEDTRRNAKAQDQLWTFLTTGEVHHYCDGVCDPE